MGGSNVLCSVKVVLVLAIEHRSREGRLVLGETLGWHRTFNEDDQVRIEVPKGSPKDGVAPDILFLKVPEGN